MKQLISVNYVLCVNYYVQGEEEEKDVLRVKIEAAIAATSHKS